MIKKLSSHRGQGILSLYKSLNRTDVAEQLLPYLRSPAVQNTIEYQDIDELLKVLSSMSNNIFNMND